MSVTARDTGTHRAILPHELEAEQRRMYDRRVATWPVRLAAIIIGILWLAQLVGQSPWNNFVKPPIETSNGIVANTSITTDQPGPFIDNGYGFYHQVTQMAMFGNKGPISSYGNFIKSFVLPRWQVFAWIFFVLEVIIVLGLVLGILSRLAGFFCFLLGLIFFLGLSQATGGWVWSYAMLATFGFVFMITGPGRFLGVDQLIRPRLREAVSRDSRLAKFLYVLT